MSDNNKVAVTFNARLMHHLSTGLYPDVEAVFRELIANAKDSGSQNCWITITDKWVEVWDDGRGIPGKPGFQQFLELGSDYKLKLKQSGNAEVDQTGEKGLGAKSAFALGTVLEVSTQALEPRPFSGKVIWDINNWTPQKELDILNCQKDPSRDHGTTVRISGLKKPLDPDKVRKWLIEHISGFLKREKMAVRISDKGFNPALPTEANKDHYVRLIPLHLQGTKIPINRKIMVNNERHSIEGEITIVPDKKKAGDVVEGEPGIYITIQGSRVSGPHFFGLDQHARGVNRIYGEVEANCLTPTTGRDDVLKDDYWNAVSAKLHEIMEQDVAPFLEQEINEQERQRSQKALDDAVDSITKALQNIPDISLPPSGRFTPSEEGNAVITFGGGTPSPPPGPPKPHQKPREAKGKHDIPTGGTQPTKKKGVVADVKVNGTRIPVEIGPYESEYPAFSDTAIYINTNHRVYKHKLSNPKEHRDYLIRLISTHVALMTGQKDPQAVVQLSDTIYAGAIIG